MASQQGRSPAVIVTAFAAGLVLAWAPLRSAPIPLRETAQYPVWVLLVAIVCAACPIVWARGSAALERLRPRHHPVREALVYAGCAGALAVAILVVPTALPGPRPPDELLPYLGPRLLVLYIAVAVAAGPAVIAVNRIGDACARGADSVPDLVSWRSVLNAQLVNFGGLVILGTLTTSALREAAISTHGAGAAAFPATSVLLFGGCLTLVVGLAHLPSSNAWRQRAQTVLDETFAVPARLDGDWQDQLRRRHDLANVLGIDVSNRPSIQNWLIVGGPLITTAIALLVPIG